MDEKKIMELLKEKLKVQIKQTPFSDYVFVQLLLDGEVISEDSFDITKDIA